MRWTLLLLVNFLIFQAVAGSAWAQSEAGDEATPPGFNAWLVKLRADAIVAGIRTSTLDEVLEDVQYLPRVVELDRKQPEFSLTFAQYLAKVVTDGRVSRGKKRLQEHKTYLNSVARQYKVPSRFIVALWGIETDYGNLTGGFSVISALSTMAFDGRRPDFFRDELLRALRIIDEGHIRNADMTGSWAGAMGQCQFMPSSFLRFAVDADDDGHADIWRNPKDVMASVANYLHQSGWNDKITWGREVRLPKKFDASLVGLETRKTLRDWSRLGVRAADGKRLPAAPLKAALLQPDGPGQKAFLVYDNFDVILKWNRSFSFALAVGHLSDRLAGSDHGNSLVRKESVAKKSRN